MKRFLFLFFASLFALTTWAANITIDGIIYTTNSDGVTCYVNGLNGFTSTELTIPESIEDSGDTYTVTAIGSDAFNGAYSTTPVLTLVSIPETVTDIKARAFNKQTSLSTIYCYAETAPSVTTNSLQDVSATVYIPSGSKSSYESVWTSSTAAAASLTFVEMGEEGGSGSYKIVFSPENGGTETLTESGLKEFVISCEDGISMSSTGINRTWSLNDGTSGVSITKNAPSDDGKSLTLTLAQTITTAGTYSFGYSQRGTFYNTIPAGTFLLGPDEVESDEMSYSFTLVEEDSGSDAPYTVEPDEDVVQQSLSYVKFIAKGAICWSEEIEASEVKVYKDEVEVASGASVEDDWTSGTWDDAVNIYFDTTLVEEGEYKVVVPAGFMNLGSWTVLNDKITLNYTVDGSLDTGGTGSGDHEGDYITVETIGLDVTSTSQQVITYVGPSGTEYEISARYSENFEGDINFYASGYLKNTTSVGNLSKVIFEPDEATTSSTIFYVRASNEPWDGTNFTSYGDEVGQVAVNEGGTIEPSSDYAYFACYGGASLTNYRFKSIEVVWAEASEEEGGIPSGYVLDPADESEVETLSTISIYPESGSLSLNDYNAVGVVMSKTGGQVGTVTFSDDYDDELQMGWCIATLSEEISDMGTYYVTFPAGVFYNFGEGAANPEFTATYYVTGVTSSTEYTYDPADGSTIPSLSEFTVYYKDGIDCSWNYTKEITVTDKNDNVVANSDDCETTYPDDDPWGDGLYCTITLDTKVVAAGDYTVNIPAGYFIVGSNYIDSEALTIHYTIDGSEDTGGTGGSGDHEGDYITVETIGLDVTSTSQQVITYVGPSGTEYEISARYSENFEGDINFYASGYLKNTTSVGNLSKVIFEPDEATTSSTIFYVRASNEPWDGTNFTSYGDEVGQIAVNEGGTIEPSSDYAYFACYGGASLTNYRFKSIEVVWAEDGGNSGSGVPEGYTVDPAEGEVPSLSVISLDTEGGLGESQYFYDETKKAEFKVVNDETGETVATLKEWEIMLDETTWHAWAEIRLSNEVSEAGSYTVTIPEGVFLDATDYNYNANPAFTLHYTVTGSTGGGEYEIVVDPESGTSHSELSEFTVICEDGLGFNEKNAISITRDGEELDIYVNAWEITDGIKTTMDFSTDEWGDYPTSLTEAGEYVITIPAKFFILGDDKVESEELTITYYVTGSSDTGGVTHHENDYLTPEIMGFDLASSSKQTIESFIGPSGTDYGAYCYVGVLNEGTGIDYTGDFNISSAGDYIRNNESVGYLRQLIIEPDENYTSDYVLPVRVAHEPYTGSSYSAFSEYGELVAEIVVKEGGSVELSDDYEYFAVGTANNWSEAKRFKAIELVWEVEGLGTPSYVVDPAEGQVESLSVIEFKSDDENVEGFMGNYEYSAYTTEALVYSRLERGEAITTATLEGAGDVYADEYDTSIIITLKDEITEPGSYIVVIPEGSFYWIVNDEPILNDEIDLSYYIEAPQGEYSFDPEDGSKLSSLLTFTVYNSEGIDPSYNYEGEITVEDESGAVVAYDIDCEPNYPDSWDEPTPSCTITLSAEIVEPGTYTITIPEGYFIVGSYYVDSKELVISYIIEEGSDSGSDVPEGYIIDPEDGSTLESLYMINIAYDGGDVTVDSSLRKDDAVKASLKVVDDESGETVATLDSYEMVKDDNGYQTYDLAFTSEITSSGSYTVTIPAGVFYDPNYVACAEFHLHYTIEVNPGTGTGIGGISINDENVEGIYSTSGQKLNKTQKGVNIIRFSDGTVKKLYVK